MHFLHCTRSLTGSHGPRRPIWPISQASPARYPKTTSSDLRLVIFCSIQAFSHPHLTMASQDLRRLRPQYHRGVVQKSLHIYYDFYPVLCMVWHRQGGAVALLSRMEHVARRTRRYCSRCSQVQARLEIKWQLNSRKPNLRGL